MTDKVPFVIENAHLLFGESSSTLDGFPARLVRTIVFDHPTGKAKQILVSVYSDGEIEVAWRSQPGATWGIPWTRRDEE